MNSTSIKLLLKKENVSGSETLYMQAQYLG